MAATTTIGFEKIQKIIRDLVRCEIDQVTPEARLCEDLGCDSIDLIELCMMFEDVFNVEIANAEAVQWMTVQDIVNCLTDERTLSTL